MVQQRLVTAVNCVLYPLDEQVAMRIPPWLNIHDAIIVATALVYRDMLICIASCVFSGVIETRWPTP